MANNSLVIKANRQDSPTSVHMGADKGRQPGFSTRRRTLSIVPVWDLPRAGERREKLV